MEISSARDLGNAFALNLFQAHSSYQLYDMCKEFWVSFFREMWNAVWDYFNFSFLSPKMSYPGVSPTLKIHFVFQQFVWPMSIVYDVIFFCYRCNPGDHLFQKM